jgi:hypothetical protein
MLRLNAADIADRDGAAEKWIFTEVFEVSSVQGGTVDIDAGSEQECGSSRERIPAQLLSKIECEFTIPGCRQTDPAGVGDRGSGTGPSAIWKGGM